MGTTLAPLEAMYGTEALLHTRKEAAPEVDTEKIKIMFMFCQQNAGEETQCKVFNISFQYVATFRYLGMMVINQHCTHEEINSLNSRNAFYHAVQNPLSSCLLSKDVKITIHKTIILPTALHGC
jgi:hypothetical protein